MLKHWSYFLFLLWVSFLLLSSILLFMDGFLLHRITQTKNSTCKSYTDSFCNLQVNSANNYQCSEDMYILAMKKNNRDVGICTDPKARIVIVLIDALRYDFATYNATMESNKPFQNKLPVIDELLKTYPSSTKLFKFVADPPTTTMQRLKALTTGSLPTFIDAGSNFASSEISEDNIIDQLVKANQNIVFMGDDTWIKLYPNRFLRTYAYPSFNVWDLDTVDSGIKEHLFVELEKQDWSLLIGHFLGVDHCGHRYGPNHPEMERKLLEMNEVIRNLSRKLPNDTILIVMGDHGMTATGDHGGDSIDEVTAALFVHSKKPLVQMPDNEISVKQVDIVPTLSSILGIPIPFSNLGITILNILPRVHSSNPGKNWKLNLLSIWSNVNQVTSYIKDYNAVTNIFKPEKMLDLDAMYSALNVTIQNIETYSKFIEFVDKCKIYLHDIRSLCEEVWIQFDSFSMSRGLLMMFLILFFTYLITDGIPLNKMPEIFMSSFLRCCYLTLIFAVIICITCYVINFSFSLLPNLYFSMGIVSILLLAILIIQNWEIISMNWNYICNTRNWTDIVCRFILLLCTSNLFSNSYIVEEAKVLMFLFVTSVVIMVLDVHKNETVRTKGMNTLLPFKKSYLTKAIGLAIFVGLLIKISMHYLRCRSEQQSCLQYNSSSWKSGASFNNTEGLITLVSLALLVTCTRIWLQNSGNLVGYSPTVLMARYSPTVLVVCICGYGVLHHLSTDIKNRLLGPFNADMLAWVVYILVAAGIFSIILCPLFTYILPKQNMSSVQLNITIPQLYKQFKGMLNEKKQKDEVPVIWGLASIYSTVFIAIGVYLLLLMALLLGVSLAPTTVIMFFTATFVLIISSLSRNENANTIDDFLNIPSSSLITWVIMSLYFFYASGHQPTFPNIAWDAAFVGTGGHFSHNFIPAILIIINTFGSHMIFGVTLPLLLIAPFSFFAIFPNWVTKKFKDKDFSRGDILLFERESLMMTNFFKLSSKYLICHGLRVFASMLAATIHCRHLMVWAIFAPKLIFESIGFIVTMCSVLVGYLLLIRINYKLDKLVNLLVLQYR